MEWLYFILGVGLGGASCFFVLLLIVMISSANESREAEKLKDKVSMPEKRGL
jgi:predicted small secreted protein